MPSPKTGARRDCVRSRVTLPAALRRHRRRRRRRARLDRSWIWRARRVSTAARAASRFARKSRVAAARLLDVADAIVAMAGGGRARHRQRPRRRRACCPAPAACTSARTTVAGRARGRSSAPEPASGLSTHTPEQVDAGARGADRAIWRSGRCSAPPPRTPATRRWASS